MNRWDIQHRIACVEWFIETKSVTITQRNFRREFRLRNAPCRNTILSWYTTFRTVGSLKDKSPPGPRRTVSTPENRERVRLSAIRSPKKSARSRAAALGMSDKTVRRILHSMKFHPYKIANVQELSENDRRLRVEFCIRFLELQQRDRTVNSNLFMSDEAHFHLNGDVNRQNCRYWSTENPHQLHERPLHSPKVTVWCAVSSSRLIGPYFFEGEDGETVTVTAARYVNMLENLRPEIDRLQTRGNIWFQQDGATAHTARISMALLREMFPGRLISRFGDVPWPARSPDLSVPDFFLWGYLKSLVYNTLPRTIEELKRRIEDEIVRIDEDMLRRVMGDFTRRLGECIENEGGHLLRTIFKK